MDLLCFIQEPPKGGQPAPAGDAKDSPGGNSLVTMLPFVLMFVVMWFLLIRPQRKQAKQREAMIAAIKKNDHVITTGGIYGIVDRIKDNRVVLKIDENNDVRIEVAKSAIAGVEKVSGAEGEAKPEAAK